MSRQMAVHNSQDSLRLAGAYDRKECDILIKRSTLIKAYAGEYGIDIRTVSCSRKSPHRFYILRDALADLEHKPKIIVRDIRSFAVLCRNVYDGTLEIEFNWLQGDGYSLMGWEETVFMPYEEFAAFVRNSTMGGPSEWKTLSVDKSESQPKIIFKSHKNLHKALQNGTVRHKLVCFLRDGFGWPDAGRIELCDDFMPYSFTFREIKNGKTALSGGLILHLQDDIGKSYYSIHT